MTIAELKNSIEEMRKCYAFNDDSTAIFMTDDVMGRKLVVVRTVDNNGTEIEMQKSIDRKQTD